ncbi:archaemetzincin-2 [Discoglossus pictus]
MQVIKHSPETLRNALISTDGPLQELYENYSPTERKLLNEAFHPDSTLFLPVTIHSSNDWIPNHQEPPETFQSFYHKPDRCIPTSKRNTIYVQTIGPFGDSCAHTQDYIGWLKGYCQAFFYGLSVKVQGPIPISDTGCSFRINKSTKNLQVHAGDLIEYLWKVKPADAFCIVGATMIDLYPKDSWNFVFGSASLTEGTGIFSFARYDEDFYSTSYQGRIKKSKKISQGNYSVFDGYYTPPITSMLLLRSCKTLAHEIGHMFGIRHCQWLYCVMQGSNHLEESDRRPLHLCPICLRKLQSCIGFNITERYMALLKWMEEDENDSVVRTASQELGAYSHQPWKIPKPIEAFREQKEWLHQCLNFLNAPIQD